MHEAPLLLLQSTLEDRFRSTYLFTIWRFTGTNLYFDNTAIMHQINLLKVHEAFSYRMNITNIIRARAHTMHLKQNKKHFFSI